MTLRPDSSLSAARLPLSIHRRTVSSLTPSRAAASLIRMFDTDPPLFGQDIRVYGTDSLFEAAYAASM